MHKHILLAHLEVWCQLSVMRDLISCSCHSLPSRVQPKWGEQALLIKISEQSHACRCLLCFGWRTRQTVPKQPSWRRLMQVSGIRNVLEFSEKKRKNP